MTVGSRRDAILYSVGANQAHGLRRSNADKRKAVMTLLGDEEWSQWSNREIGRRCGVSPEFVNRLRKSSLPTVGSEDFQNRPHSPESTVEDSTKRTYTTKHGTQSTMKVGNIGQINIDDLPDDVN